MIKIFFRALRKRICVICKHQRFIKGNMADGTWSTGMVIKREKYDYWDEFRIKLVT